MAVAAAGASAQDRTPYAGQLEPCNLPSVTAPALCGHLEVPEDPSMPGGRTLKLRVVVLPATGPDAQPDPIYHISGGPGTAVTDEAPALSRHAFRARRDQVLVDQRGAGDSNGLFCLEWKSAPVETLLGPLFDGPRIAECRRQLERRADPALYTTAVAVHDLDAVRRSLGHARINLHGTSYGTRAALVYLRRYGAHVRSVVLNASLAMDAVMPAGLAPDAESALATVIADCGREPECAAAFPRLESNYGDALGRVRRAPVEVSVVDPRTGRIESTHFGQAGFAEGLRAMLYDPEAARDIPRFLHAGASGVYEGLAQFALDRAERVHRTFALGLYLSITCAEDVPFTNPTAVYDEGENTFLADLRARGHYEACESWPKGSIPPGFHDPVRSDVPVLILNGAADPVTPPAMGARTASTLPRSVHVVVPYGGHGFSGLRGEGCVTDIKRRFLEDPAVDRLDTSCLADVRRKPFRL